MMFGSLLFAVVSLTVTNAPSADDYWAISTSFLQGN